MNLKPFIPHKLNELTPTRARCDHCICSLVLDVANFPNRMVITLDDGTSRIEVSCNHERFQRFKDIVQVDKVVVIEGEIYEREGFDRPMGRLTKAFALNEIRQKRANCIKIQLLPEHLSHTLPQDLSQILLPFCNVDLCQHIPLQLQLDYSYARADLNLGVNWKVAPMDELLARLRDYFGKERIYIEYQVKSKAAKAAPKPYKQAVAAPPEHNIDDALDAYHTDMQQQYS